MADRIGQQLGNYRLLKRLASGGFAEVYLGEHIYLETQAAIKVLSGQLSPQQGQEFRDEARTIAKLIHPNIVRVLEFGVEQDGTPFLVMDYAPNGTLRNLHPAGTQLSLSMVISYVKQIASAIQAAHNKKIVHRDIKPMNMLLGPNNEVWLSDFGIAVIAHSTRSQTRQDLAGSWNYTAPEQFKGKAQPASDQYALGIVVYEWLCGSPPFQGDFTELYHQHISVPPPPLRPTIPTISAAAEQVVLKALAKDPQERFASIHEFADALEQTSVSAQATTTILPPNQSLPTIEPTILATPQPQALDLDALYREGVTVRSKGDLPNLAHAASCWQQILNQDSNYGNGTLAPQMQRLLQELHPLRVDSLRQQAVQASRTGEWGQEISSWKALLGLEPHDTQAKERIPIAEHNEKYVWRYENAQQFVKEGNREAARTTLQELWHDAPYYSDPAGLAKKVRIRVPPSYEKTKAITQRKERRSQFISELEAEPLLIWFAILCLLGGLGSSVGFLTQSWLWTLVTVSLTTVLAYVLGYRKALNLPTMLCIAAISVVIAFGCTWYASTFHYDQSGVSIPLGGFPQVKKFLLISQLRFGLLFSTSCSLVTAIIEFLFPNGTRWHKAIVGKISYSVLLFALLIWFLLMIGPADGPGWGFGFGIGWELAFFTGPILGLFNSIGLGAWVRVLFD